MKRIEFTDEQVSTIIEMYESGMTLKAIGEALGISRTPIKRVLQENKCQTRDQSHCNRKFELNENYFDTIDTPNKAYIFGLLYSDGCNYPKQNLIRLSLQEKDRDILEKVKKEIGSNFPLRRVERTKYSPNWQPLYELEFHNQHLSEQLEKMGMVNNKSYFAEFPTCVPDEFLRDFVRGYVDGNGSVGFYDYPRYVNVTSTLKFCATLSSIIKEKLEISVHIYGKKTCDAKMLAINKSKDILKFLNWIYDGSELHLCRKYEAYLEIKEYMTKKTLSD